jgi:hypothetical protein
MNRNIVISLGVIFVAACSSSSSPGTGSGEGTGPLNEGEGTFVEACQNMGSTDCESAPSSCAAITFRACNNFYASPSYIGSSAEKSLVGDFEYNCTTSGGTIQKSVCPLVGSLGGCLIGPSNSNAAPVWQLSILYNLDGGTTTAATEQEDCNSQGALGPGAGSYVSPSGNVIAPMATDGGTSD